jgi:hypothetical protein
MPFLLSRVNVQQSIFSKVRLGDQFRSELFLLLSQSNTLEERSEPCDVGVEIQEPKARTHDAS